MKYDQEHEHICPYQPFQSARRKKPQTGFTLPEVLIAVVIIGILAAIAAVGWQSFWNARVLTAAQDEVFQAMRQAQIQAIRTRSSWRTSIAEPNNMVQWAVHPTAASLTDISWQMLMPGIHIDPRETTLPQNNGIYRTEFSHQGHIPPPFGRLTLMIDNGGRMRRCVFTSTLLGTIRKAGNRAQPDQGGRYCY